MTNSSFDADGFRDGANGAPFSPPRGSVYAAEYARGFRDGVASRSELSSTAHAKPLPSLTNHANKEFRT